MSLEKDMKINKMFFWITIPVLVLLLLFAFQTYVGRALQGRLRSSTDDIGDQFSPGNRSTQYEPYYLASKHSVAAPGTAQPAEIPQVRKLIKKADVAIEVNDCQITAQELATLVQRASGFILSSELRSHNGNARNGRTVFKVAPEHFEGVIQAMKSFGKIERVSVTGEDVTEEYVDLQARLDNFKRVKERLNTVLEDQAKNVKDILEVERELGRVGQEIETIEGRLKYLNRQVDLSTVTVEYHEPVKAALDSINWGARLKTTMRAAAETFITVFNGMIIVLAFVFPIAIWGGVIALFVKIGIVISRKIRRKK
jgi:hypothetical protein